MKNNLVEQVKSLETEFINIRHAIHKNPEIGFKEVNTSELVANKLAEWGYKIERGFAQTGFVATLKVGNGKKILGLRAEMDALPILEDSGVPWISQNHGVSHMCGHDGHTTMLLCAAKYLAKTRNFDGTLHIIYQPAEELLCGGSKMIEDGLFKKYPCDMIFAMHNMPGLNAGEFYFRKGSAMASSDTLEIEVTGVGGHGAFPHKAVDTVLVCSQIAISLQSIVSRNVDTFCPAVITVGSLQAGDTANVIPGKGLLKLTVRTLDKETRKLVLKRISDITIKTAEVYNAVASINHVNGSPVLVNGNEATEFAYKVGCELFGKEKCHDNAQACMGSEDFSFMLEHLANGSYFFIGNGKENENGVPLHNGKYDFNDANIVPGATLWAGIVEKYLVN
ncbi:M20 aminoacylase family protein [Rouxiella sp. Mn2063]|uniref:M20 aminoacylase family protein n=1 Tax=Rouxiella sp. Mn2063 TaxID=3395262 RepID=UPI003BBABEE0